MGNVAKRAPYEAPVVTRVRLEDKQVVAMAACNQFLSEDGEIQGEYVVDAFGNRLLVFDPSL